MAEGRMLLEQPQKSALQRPWQGGAQRARAQGAAHGPGLLPAPSWQPLSCSGDEPFPAELCQLTEPACATNTCQLAAALGWRCFLFHPYVYLSKSLPFASLPAKPLLRKPRGWWGQSSGRCWRIPMGKVVPALQTVLFRASQFLPHAANVPRFPKAQIKLKKISRPFN